MRPMFESKQIKGESCYSWGGYINSGGYGQYTLRLSSGKTNAHPAHRISWYYHTGEWPSGKLVLHKCHNRECTNPDHLELGTHKDNMRHRSESGRQTRPTGSKNGNAKLTEDDVQAIKRDYSLGKVSQGKLAKQYGVTRSVISNIVNEKTWRHLLDN